MKPHPYIESMNREPRPSLKPETAVIILLITNIVTFVFLVLTLWQEGVLAKIL